MRQAHVLSRQSADQKEPHANRGGLQPARGAWRFRIDRASSWHRSLVRGFPHGAVRDLSPAAFSAKAGALRCPAAMAALMSSLANGAAQTYSARSSRNSDWRYGAVAISASRAARPTGDNVAARAVTSLAPTGFLALRLTLVGAMDFRSLRS